MYDHVFLQIEEAEGTQMGGCYILKEDPDERQQKLYVKLSQFVIDNEFPQILNRNDVPECDTNAWDKRMLRDLGDFVPESWTDHE